MRLRLGLLWACLTWCDAAPGLSPSATTGTNSLPNSSLLELPIGFLFPFTSTSPGLLAVAVAFDLDFRKNFDEELRTRLGPPVIPVADLHPSLRVQAIMGTSNSDIGVALETLLDWITGDNSFPRVAGVVGEKTSLITIPLATITSARRIVQVSGGATSPVLSDQKQFPYFFRTIGSDVLQGHAIYAWLLAFDIQSTIMMYSQEPYGQALFTALTMATTAGASLVHIHGAPVLYESSMSEDEVLRSAHLACQEAESFGGKFIILATLPAVTAELLYALSSAGNLYGNQLLGAESTQIREDSIYKPPQGFPVGTQKLMPTNMGPLSERFEALWRSMTLEDIYGSAATERYMLDRLRMPLTDVGAAPLLTEEFFQSTEPLDDQEPLARFAFDAAYTFVHAANSLLQSGVSPGNVTGQLLREAMFSTSFQGLTGFIEFDQHGDRIASLQLLNLQESQNTTLWAHVGDYSAGEIVLHSNVTWAPHGESGRSPPEDLFRCVSGFEKVGNSESCTPCRRGIGCGFQAEDGFPLGAVLPITSRSHAYLACAVAFDIDFRKNLEPDLYSRFGPPIVSIPDLHPDLKIKLQIGTSDTAANVSMKSTLDMFQGDGDLSMIAALVFGGPSSLSVPVTSNAAGFEVPHISWSSTSPDLSNKAQYPYFSRVIAPDTLQSKAIFAWMQTFDTPTSVFLYQRDAYGLGLFQSASDVASAAGMSHMILAVSVTTVLSGLDLEELRDGCRWIQQTGTKFIILGLNVVEATHLMFVMEEMEMLYGSQAYQLFGTEAAAIAEEADHHPSQGLPCGFMKLLPVVTGALFPEWAQLYSNLTPDDIYGSAARSRYMLDRMLVSLESGAAPLMSLADFAVLPEPNRLVPNLFDALYAATIAINNLLNAGKAPSEIQGLALLTAVRETTFEGVTGAVAFDQNGDRHGRYELWNWCYVADELEGSVVGYTDESFERVSIVTSDGLCWAGGGQSMSIPANLLACYPGWAMDGESGRCVQCPPGWYSDGSSGCQVCRPGYRSSANSTTCLPCGPGTFKGPTALECLDCPLGTFGGLFGTSACSDCPVGSYAAEVGQTECMQCGSGRASQALFTTMIRLEVDGLIEFTKVVGSRSNETCGCDRHSREDMDGECVPCLEGMQCPGLSTVYIEPGYYADVSLSIFTCYGDERRCVGGIPGDTCARGRRGISCAQCLPDMTTTSGVDCQPCSASDQAPFFVLLTLYLGGLVLLYEVTYATRGSAKSLSVVISAIAIGMLVTSLQQFSLLGLLNVQWLEPFKSFMRVMGVLVFDVSVLRLSCIRDVSTLGYFAFKLSVVPLSSLVMVVLYFLDVCLRRGRGFRRNRWQLVAAICALVLAFYVTLSTIALEPLNCRKHPNGRSTVLNYEAVICWETSEHVLMVAMAGAFVLALLSYLAAVVIIVWQFPLKLQKGDTRFVRAFSFLFFRFKAGKYSFIVVHLVQSFLLAACLLIPTASLALIALGMLILVRFAASLIMQPWRTALMNFVDASLLSCIIFVVFLSMLFAKDADADLPTLSWLCLIVSLSGLCLIPLAGLRSLIRRYVLTIVTYEYFLCHHKAGSGAYTRLLKLVIKSQKLPGDVFIDSDNLDNLDYLFDYIRHDTRNFVIVATELIFHRPWCMGEMTSARQSKLPAVCLSLPGAPEIKAAFLAGWRDAIDVQLLTERGFSVQTLEDTLMWINDVHTIEVPAYLSRPIMDGIIRRMHMRHDAVKVKVVHREEILRDCANGVSEGSLGSADCMGKACHLLFDTSSLEAAATAYVLQRMLMPLVPENQDLVPSLLESEDESWLVRHRSLSLVVCMNGTFEKPAMLKMLMATYERRCLACPVLAETSFRFPPQDTITWLSNAAPSGIPVSSYPLLQTVVVKLFKEIAASFEPSHASMTILEVNAREILRRIRISHDFRQGSSIRDQMRSKSDKRSRSFYKRKSNKRKSSEDSSPHPLKPGSEKSEDEASVASCSSVCDTPGSTPSVEHKDPFAIKSEEGVSPKSQPPDEPKESLPTEKILRRSDDFLSQSEPLSGRMAGRWLHEGSPAFADPTVCHGRTSAQERTTTVDSSGPSTESSASTVQVMTELSGASSLGHKSSHGLYLTERSASLGLSPRGAARLLREERSVSFGQEGLRRVANTRVTSGSPGRLAGNAANGVPFETALGESEPLSMLKIDENGRKTARL